ncbi:hypothetical protein KOW79_022244 [Hemibagrus wyckioides]|uniref:Wiskott-Aldrich syndrome protein family member n=1 Tax=Hemibagrus wyckioides TaxID=337641 RepID=A0A9D3N2S3_9TELE|nr:hypothetical protein KOW79_022244 [Hemibagrus wyckioides]
MPLVKRNIKPHHMCRVPVPESIGSELECVTNNTLSSIIHQLSSLSKHAEDVFGELFNEANTFYMRANSLQDRIDRLAVKVTQLDSSVEEVSLQDVNMWKAFRSSTTEDQQVMSRISIPNPVAEMYSSCEKPPALSVLSTYREDHVDGMKFYTDPSYFFDLWKEKMLQDTEEKRKERRRQREQRSVEDGTLQREVRKVRKAQNRRQEWNMMALDKELRPDHRNPYSVQQGALSDSSLSPEASLMEYYASSGPSHPPTIPAPPISNPGPSSSALSYPLPPVPLPGPLLTPPPPGPPPILPASSHLMGTGEGRSKESQPITDGRNDLLSAIRMGIQLKKVQEQQEQRVMRECSENDVASILSRRIAVEYSDSEDESELDVNEWSD